MIRWSQKLQTPRYAAVILLLISSVYLFAIQLHIDLDGWVDFHPAFLLALTGFFYFILLLARDFFIVPHMLLPSIFVSQDDAWIAQLRQCKDEFLAYNSNDCSSIQITTRDKVKIDAMAWENKRSSSGRWVMWLCANGFHYESILDFLQEYAFAIDASFIAFSYRAVGDSERILPSEFSDLVLDAEAVFDYLVSIKLASPEKILIHGHSMGAAIGTVLRLHRDPNGPIINDRSFSNLSLVTSQLFFQEPDGIFFKHFTQAVSLLLSSLIISGLSFGYITLSLLFLCLNYLLCKLFQRFPSLVRSMLPFFFSLIGWNPDIANMWSLLPSSSSRKIIIVHPEDTIIRMPSSLWQGLSPVGQQNSSLFKLPSFSSFDGNYHGALLKDFSSSWNQFLSQVASLF